MKSSPSNAARPASHICSFEKTKVVQGPLCAPRGVYVLIKTLLKKKVVGRFGGTETYSIEVPSLPAPHLCCRLRRISGIREILYEGLSKISVMFLYEGG